MYRLLVVDDEQYAVEGIIKAIGWDTIGITVVQGASSTRQAKAYMRRQPFDIIICDIEMPEESGVDVWAVQYCG